MFGSRYLFLVLCFLCTIPSHLNLKKHLLPWIKKIVEEAKIRNQILIAFSHYPMCDFNDGAEIATLIEQKSGNSATMLSIFKFLKKF